MKRLTLLIALVPLLLSSISSSAIAATSKTLSFKAEIWADNWFALYVNGKKVGEDSVSIKTERSFNSETINFKASYPLTIAVIAKDYVENASGLEYIGKSNQQIGDAGIAIQVSEVTSKRLVAYSNSSWKVLVIDKAPLNEACVTSSDPLTECRHKNISLPKNWASSSYQDKNWTNARTFSAEEVGVKEGYFDINWSSKVELIWSSDLRLDNTIVLRIRISTPIKSSTASAASASISTDSNSFRLTSSEFVDGGALPKEFTCDGAGISPPLSWQNPPAGSKSFAIIMDSEPGPPRPGESNTGKHFYLTVFNIPSDAVKILKGEPGVGTLGQNFLGKKAGYTPPCSQGPGAKKYSFTIYALSSRLDLGAGEATLSSLEKAMADKILAKAQISAVYAR